METPNIVLHGKNPMIHNNKSNEYSRTVTMKKPIGNCPPKESDEPPKKMNKSLADELKTIRGNTPMKEFCECANRIKTGSHITLTIKDMQTAEANKMSESRAKQFKIIYSAVRKNINKTYS